MDALIKFENNRENGFTLKASGIDEEYGMTYYSEDQFSIYFIDDDGETYADCNIDGKYSINEDSPEISEFDVINDEYIRADFCSDTYLIEIATAKYSEVFESDLVDKLTIDEDEENFYTDFGNGQEITTISKNSKYFLITGEDGTHMEFTILD